MKLKAKGTIIAMVIVVVIGSIALNFAARDFSAQPSEAVHLKSVDWLPAAATDVSFYRNGDPLFPMYSYECTIPYGAVVAFAREQGWRLDEKRDVRLSGRDLLKLPRIKAPDAPFEDVYSSALIYETIQSNGGGILAIYHPSTSRLFVHYSAN